jgi:hypothetical protein
LLREFKLVRIIFSSCFSRSFFWFAKTKDFRYSLILFIAQIFALAVYRNLVREREYSVSSPYIIGFSKTRIFSITVVVLPVFGKNNIAIFRFLVVSIRSYFITSTIYPKDKLNLFFILSSTFG